MAQKAAMVPSTISNNLLQIAGMDHPSMPEIPETENHGESSSKEIVSTAKVRLLYR
jgi:hypothetical protein